MPKRVTMNVSVTPELRAFVEREVRAGRHASASEVVRAALSEARDRRRDRKDARAALKRSIDEALQQLRRGEHRDGAEVFAELIHRARGRRKAS